MPLLPMRNHQRGRGDLGSEGGRGHAAQVLGGEVEAPHGEGGRLERTGEAAPLLKCAHRLSLAGAGRQRFMS